MYTIFYKRRIGARDFKGIIWLFKVGYEKLYREWEESKKEERENVEKRRKQYREGKEKSLQGALYDLKEGEWKAGGKLYRRL